MQKYLCDKEKTVKSSQINSGFCLCFLFLSAKHEVKLFIAKGIFFTTMTSKIFYRFKKPYLLTRRLLSVIKCMFLTAPADMNKVANEKKNCPYCLIPKAQIILKQYCDDKWCFHLCIHHLSRLNILMNSFLECTHMKL